MKIYSNSIFFLIFWLKFNFCIKVRENLENIELKLLSFLNQISIQNFPNECDYFYISTSKFESNFFQNLLNQMVQLNPKGYFSINFPFNDTIIPAGLELNEFENVHKLTKYCHLVYIDIFKNPQNYQVSSENLISLLTKIYEPILKRDLDYFWIFTKSKEVEKILGMKFFQGIKYKLIFTLSSSNVEIFSGKLFPWPDEDLRIPLQFNIDSNEDVPGTNELFPDYLMNFEGRRIRVSVPVRLITFFEVQFNRDKNSYESKRGSHHFVFVEIQRKLNFTYRMKPSPGTWIGSTGDVYNDAADIALCTGQIYQRFKIIGTTKLFTFAVVIFAVAKPQKLFSYKVIFWPMRIEVWALFTLSIVLSFGVFIIINKFGVMGSGTFRLRETLDFIVASIFEQGLILTKKKNGRLFSFTLLYFLLVLSIVYRAKLYEFLVFPKLSVPPKTFYELADRDDYSWGLERAGIGNAPHADFRNNPHPKIKKMFARMSLEHDPVACFTKLLIKNFACIVYENQAYFTFYKNFSTISRKYPFTNSKHVAFSMDWGSAVQRGSNFRENMNKIIGPLLDSGLISRYIQVDLEETRSKRIKWQKENNVKPIFTEDYFYEGARQLSLFQIQGIFFVCLILTFFSICTFFLEYSLRKNIFNKNTRINNFPEVSSINNDDFALLSISKWKNQYDSLMLYK